MQVLAPVFLIGIAGFYYTSRKNRERFALFYCFVLALVAFSYQPHTQDDLYNEYQNLSGIVNYGWGYFAIKSNPWIVSAKFDGLYFTQLYYYIFAQLPIKNFLPAVTR